MFSSLIFKKKIPYLNLSLLEIALVLFLIIIIFQGPLEGQTRALLFIAEEFPQVPVKPLSIFTNEPAYEEIMFNSKNGKIVADLFTPNPRFGENKPASRPAIIITMGVHMDDENYPILRHFARTMSRLGYVVLWPRLQALEKREIIYEEPETFVRSFEYTEDMEMVEGGRISFVGFSIGSSTGLVAASDPRIAEKVNGVVFFGGYYDMLDYIVDAASQNIEVNGRIMSWTPSDDTIWTMEDVLQTQKLEGTLSIFTAQNRNEAKSIAETLSSEERAKLDAFSPEATIENFKGDIFILHDIRDVFVPYTESIKLNEALGNEHPKTFLLVNIFEHVQPQKGISTQIAMEFIKLYGFLSKVLSTL